MFIWTDVDWKLWWEIKYFFRFDLLVRTSFKLLIFKPYLRTKLGIDFSKFSNERELSYYTDCRYFYILLKSIGIYAIKRNGRYIFYQKDCWHWEKKSSQLKRLQQIPFKKLKKECPRDFFIKTKKSFNVSQACHLFFTQKFSNRKICFAVFVFNQIHNNFNFEELSSRNSFKTFIEKIKILQVVY